MLEPTNLLLLACALLYLLIGEPREAGILLVFVLAISLLDALQQRRSRRALAALAQLSAPRARVIRDGTEMQLDPGALQLGDQLRLEEGDRVCADARLLEGVGLWLDESLLTGESLPVLRSAEGELLRAGSLVAAGRGRALVVAVGASTELGRLGRSLALVEPPPTRLQQQTRHLTARLTLAALGLCAALALLQVSLVGDGVRALLAALALALALLPNEIPVVLALFLALGSLRLARIGVLARWPAAVESLGSATVLAVDKTGTLTENRMAVQELCLWPGGQRWCDGEPLLETWHPLLELALLASRQDPVDAMEQAILRLVEARLPPGEHRHPDWPLQGDYPLQRDLLVVSRLWHDAQGRAHIAAKGAPEAVVRLCHLAPEPALALLQAADAMASRGLRVLAVARGLEGAPLHPGLEQHGRHGPPADVHDFLFEPMGLMGLADPLRPEVPEAILRARAAGVRVVMISGDAPGTARAIADQAGLPPGPVLCGDDLEPLSDEGLQLRLPEVSVFARMMPAQKLRLVRCLQAAGEVVAMTGDGVNDAPALRAADIGVAMGRRGTAVAREAADLVLLQDSFSSLVEALALGRRIEANLHRALGYTLAIHVPIAVLSALPLLWPGQPLLLLPLHIALLHLVIDPACTVVFEAIPATPAQMRHAPRPPEAPLFPAASWRPALTQGGLLAVVALLLARWPGLPEMEQRALVFSLLLLAAGGLVWWHGEARCRWTQAGAAVGVGLWLLLQASPALQRLLLLAPLSPPALALLVAALLLLLLLAWGLGRRRPLGGAAVQPLASRR
ncbi:MAG: HAD-IC family P-type ATPase [Synechococcaceae cyanobacterium]|nr:HAD-IC family P-type ATPase [Synechococcaceae cyanobacterium]